MEGIQRCYLLDFLGPKGFAMKLAQQSSCEIIGFDHRKSRLPMIPSADDHPNSLRFHINLEKSSSRAVYEYFSNKLANVRYADGTVVNLLDPKDRDRLEIILKCLEDGDLRRWSLAHVRAFNIGLSEWRSRLNCTINPYMFEQLLELNSGDLITGGDSYISSLQAAANKSLDNVFRVRLGRGFYGECLVKNNLVHFRFSFCNGVRVDQNSNLSDEIGKQLSVKSAAAGLRPIGAVVYMQRRNLKMCLRTTDGATDTSEVAKAYGGGGSPSSSSFIIRMDEYNQWRSVRSS